MTGSVAIIVTIVVIAFALLAGRSARGSGDQYAARGLELHAAEDHVRCVRVLQTALDKGVSPEQYPLVRTCLGNSYYELDEYDLAIENHKKALDADPQFYNAWVNLGIAYRIIGEFDEAEECYKKALAIEPEYAELHSSIGALYIFQEKYHLAVIHLEKATELDKQIPSAWSNLALAYATIGQFDKADAMLKKSVILGYQKAAIIRERIDSLKAVASDPQPGGDQTGGPQTGDGAHNMN
ncbi:MAG: tetratricopeptide repeat protein [Phycisphaerae bacterium]|jgi:Tfp pilus assembly protein PilF|nr:tetratricopeptide repeat protein [Phycisphaerae bacterium]